MRPESDNFVFINSSKVTDHFAIIPTAVPPNALEDVERKIYGLARERFVVAWLKPCVWGELEATLECAGETFRLKLRKNEDDGFKVHELRSP